MINITNYLERGTETILVADDEPMVRELIATLLSNQGYTVLEADSGYQALALAQEHLVDGIDLLITDIVMPGLDGVQLSAAFRELFPEAKILLMSGYAEESKVRSIAAQPNVRFIEKPFTPRALTYTIRNMLDRPD